ncbi:MAG: hypothetical protein JRE23_00015 [Deltaproteobacteria bacterium]|nr:hypothetical protein [Deltaproteobacteria bacterium]
MKEFIALAGIYLTAENIAWFLGAVFGLEQMLAYTKAIKSNSSLELVWNIFKYIYEFWPKKAGRVVLPILLLVISIGCTTLPLVEDLREDIELAETTLVVVEGIVAELLVSGVTSPDNIDEMVKGTVKARELIEAAKVFLKEGNRADAVEAMIKFAKIILEIKKE